MSDNLLRQIELAQVEAAENVVVKNLRRKGLLPTTTKTAIVIPLDDLAKLQREYISTLAPRDRLETQLRFSMFLMWLRRRDSKNEQEATS